MSKDLTLLTNSDLFWEYNQGRNCNNKQTKNEDIAFVLIVLFILLSLFILI